MKKIYQLILKSYLGPLVLTFFIIIFILMMNFVWRYIDELVGKGLDPMVILELIVYATINMIPMGLPLAILLAYGTRLFTMKNDPIEMMPITHIRGFIMRNSDIPADFIASNS